MSKQNKEVKYKNTNIRLKQGVDEIKMTLKRLFGHMMETREDTEENAAHKNGRKTTMRKAQKEMNRLY